MDKCKVIEKMLNKTSIKTNLALSVWNEMTDTSIGREITLDLIDNFTFSKFESFWEMARSKYLFAAKFEIADARKVLILTLFPYAARVKALTVYMENFNSQPALDLWLRILSDAETNPFFAIQLNHIVMSYSTVDFRELTEDYGDYWNNLAFSNQIDTIDAAFASLY